MSDKDVRESSFERTVTQEQTLRYLRYRVEQASGGQCTATVGGWQFTLDYELNGVPGRHVTAVLTPPGRSSTIADWQFLDRAVALLGVPDMYANLLTPFESTDPNAVHHWHWGVPGAILDVVRKTRLQP